MWLKSGDFSTASFQNHACIRNHWNKTSIIMDGFNCIHSNFESISKCFSNFYSNLWAYSSNVSIGNLLQSMPNEFNSLSSTDKDQLIRPVTLNEEYHTLRTMPKGKSFDGLNVEFYLYYWDLAFESLFKGINLFIYYYFFLQLNFIDLG